MSLPITHCEENRNRESTGEMFVTRSHSGTLHNMADNCEPQHNMADNCENVALFPKLENLCVKFIRGNVNYWKPEEFLGKMSCFNQSVVK